MNGADGTACEANVRPEPGKTEIRVNGLDVLLTPGVLAQCLRTEKLDRPVALDVLDEARVLARSGADRLVGQVPDMSHRAEAQQGKRREEST